MWILFCFNNTNREHERNPSESDLFLFTWDHCRTFYSYSLVFFSILSVVVFYSSSSSLHSFSSPSGYAWLFPSWQFISFGSNVFVVSRVLPFHSFLFFISFFASDLIPFFFFHSLSMPVGSEKGQSVSFVLSFVSNVWLIRLCCVSSSERQRQGRWIYFDGPTKTMREETVHDEDDPLMEWKRPRRPRKNDGQKEINISRDTDDDSHDKRKEKKGWNRDQDVNFHEKTCKPEASASSSKLKNPFVLFWVLFVEKKSSVSCIFKLIICCPLFLSQFLCFYPSFIGFSTSKIELQKVSMDCKFIFSSQVKSDKFPLQIQEEKC